MNRITNGKYIYVVHCIDTEGPLYESISATFDRLKKIANISLEPTHENLKKIQEKKIDLGEKSEMISHVFSERLLRYNDTWDKIDEMLSQILHDDYRMQFPDSSGNGWRYNWFILDHIGFDINPRRRDIGYHNIFDFYQEKLRQTSSGQDEIHWHFHPAPFYRDAKLSATSFLRSPHLLETLSRRIVDRNWFPSCFRAGFHAERPDSHWFLEQWIPFDFSNQAMKESHIETLQLDISNGRFGDWRRAPADWSHYHPSHDDYQLRGGCNRIIFRCLNIGTRLRVVNLEEVEKAFFRANQGYPTVLAFVSHDFRDMRIDITEVYELLLKASKKYNDVKWIHTGAKEAAMRVSEKYNHKHKLDFDIKFEHCENYLRISVDANSETFGPQPFLAIKTLDGRYLSDNFDVQVPKRQWSYIFDENTISKEAVDQIGIAANSADGSCCVVNCNPSGKIISKKNLL